MFKRLALEKESVFRQVRIVIVCEECQAEGYFYGDTKDDAVKHFEKEGWSGYQTDDAEADVLCPHCIKKLLS